MIEINKGADKLRHKEHMPNIADTIQSLHRMIKGALATLVVAGGTFTSAYADNFSDINGNNTHLNNLPTHTQEVKQEKITRNEFMKQYNERIKRINALISGVRQFIAQIRPIHDELEKAMQMAIKLQNKDMQSKIFHQMFNVYSVVEQKKNEIALEATDFATWALKHINQLVENGNMSLQEAVKFQKQVTDILSATAATPKNK